ncbi:hypothetical protein KF728_16125 [Candidatus Obscuribacterales bacterium]|nr:hypothetical protein [Candidatus Obscuribacterales bacterium]
MVKQSGIKLAADLLLTRVLPVTAGTCLLVSAAPCEARDDAARELRHARHEARLARMQALVPPLQNSLNPAFNQQIPRNTTGIETRRFDLDLSSAQRNIQLGSKLFDGVSNVTINVNGTNQTYGAGDHVTAAEYIAVQQMLSQNQQELSVGAGGTATGGSFDLNQPGGTRINNLVVPQNVSAINNFSSNRSVNLSGDLTNLGSIYGLSTSNRVRSGVISADDINNSGTISTDLTGSAFAGQRGLVKNVDLTVLAEHDLNNTGSISSSGALNLATVSGAISNSGSVSAQQGDLNVFAGNGILNNSGNISAVNGNLNIATTTLASDLVINGAGGNFSALRGDINIRDEFYTELNNTTMLGGTYSSKDLNVTGGGGTITTYVDEITGKLNTTGLAAHVTTNDGTLVLGNNCLTGDPTFANAAGDIIINGAVIAREDITILASGNIIATGNAYISTANSTGATATPSTNVTLVAGAVITLAGGGVSTPSVPTPGNAIPTGATATVSFTGGTGGNIDFSGSKYLGYLIDTSSNLSANGGGSNQQDNGGNVVLTAFSTNADNGFIIFPEARPSINTASTFANSGNVTIIGGNSAASTKSPAIKLGIIKTAVNPVQGNNSGDVLIMAAQPETVGASVTFNSAGAISAGSFETTPANLTFSGSSILFTGSVLASDGDITAIATGGTGGLSQKGTGRLQGQTVTLTSGTGGIGAGSAKKSTRLLTEANVLVMNSGSNIFINNLGSVNIGNAGTPGARAGNLGIIDISTTPDGDGDGAISVPNDGVIQASSGLLSVINLTSSSVIGGNANITTNNNALLVATTVNLATVNSADGVKGLGFGNIGTNSGNGSINVDAQFLSANTQGNVFVHSNGGEITILDSSAGNLQTFDVRTTPDAGTGNGYITIAGTIASAFGRIGTLLLASSENGAGIGGIIPGGTLVAQDVVLRDDDNLGNAGLGTASIGTADSPIVINASTLDVRTRGAEIDIQNLSKTGLEVTRINSNANRSGSFTLSSASTVHLSGDVFVINSASVTATGAGHIIVNGDIDLNGTTPVAILTTSSGSITGSGAIVNNGVGALAVTFTTSGGGVGTDTIPLETEAATITSNATGSTYIYNSLTTPVSLVSALSKGAFELAADGAININAPILTATSVKLSTTGADAITLNQSVGSAKATNYVDIAISGNAAITQATNVILGAKVLVSLSTGGGNIGASNLAPIVVSTPGLSANTDNGGNVNISALPSKKVPLTLFNSGSDGDFSLNAQSSVLLNNIQTVDGSISVVTTTGTLSTNTNSIIQVGENAANRTTGAESILLQTLGAKKSGIVIGQGTTIATFSAGKSAAGAGDISLIVGPTISQIAGPTPSNVTINTTGTGTVFYGTNGITALAPNNTLNALNANITFSTGTLPSTAISLGGNVTITADPPYTTAIVTQSPVAPSEDKFAGPRTLPLSADSMSPEASSGVQPTMFSIPENVSTASFVPTGNLNGLQTRPDYSNLVTALNNVDSAMSFASALQASAMTVDSVQAGLQPGYISETEFAGGEVPGTVYGAESDSQNTTAKETVVSRGTVLFAPPSDTLVTTPVGKIRIGEKSVALVMAFANGVAVYDLDDVRKGSIEVSVAGKSIRLSPGQHVFITSESVRSFDEVNPAQMIGYRGITSQNLGSGLKAFSAEFCVPHAINAVRPLKALIQSKHPNSKKISNHMLKTAAVLMQLRANNGEFQQVFRPSRTAWAK